MKKSMYVLEKAAHQRRRRRPALQNNDIINNMLDEVNMHFAFISTK